MRPELNRGPLLSNLARGVRDALRAKALQGGEEIGKELHQGGKLERRAESIDGSKVAAPVE